MFRLFSDLVRTTPADSDEATIIEHIATRLVRDGMGAAAIVFLESSKPLAFMGGQAAIVATPWLGGFIEPMRLERFADLFSNRDFVERLISRIEELENARAGERKKKAN